MKKLKAWFIEWNKRRAMAPFERILLEERELEERIQKAVLKELKKAEEKKEMSHKQVIVMRKDLGMRKGKMIAQGAHASLKAILDIGHYENLTEVRVNEQELTYFHLHVDTRMKDWLLGNFKKVCVYVNSEEELLALYAKAMEAGIITSLITDAGLTEFNGVPTKTCIAVGPDFEDKIDSITGGLPLL